VPLGVKKELFFGGIKINMKEICPCPKINCPNHGNCEKCNSRHVRLGFLNYCAFYTILPAIKQVIGDSPESSTAQKLNSLIAGQLQAYEKLMETHDLSQENQDRLLKKVSEFCDY
jgi:hypothetical protein